MKRKRAGVRSGERERFWRELVEGQQRSGVSIRQSIMFLSLGSANQLNAFYYLGEALINCGDQDEAEKVYTQALRTYPDDSLLYIRLAALYTNMGRIDRAVECYEAVLERGQVRPLTLHVRDGHMHAALRLGELYIQMGSAQQAERLWRHFLKLHPAATLVHQALDKLPTVKRQV